MKMKYGKFKEELGKRVSELVKFIESVEPARDADAGEFEDAKEELKGELTDAFEPHAKDLFGEFLDD